MASKKTTAKASVTASKANTERDDIAVKVASGLAHLSAQGNKINFSKVAENAYGIADAIINHRSK
jgi:hypothetical protein